MEKFNIDQWSNGINKRVVTRDGREVTIVCPKSPYNTIVGFCGTDEIPDIWNSDGKYLDNKDSDFDLFFEDIVYKFKVGDVIRNKKTGRTMKIAALCNYWYLFEPNGQNIHGLKYAHQDEWEKVGELIAEETPKEESNPNNRETESVTELEKELFRLFYAYEDKETSELKAKKYSNIFLKLMKKEFEKELTK